MKLSLEWSRPIKLRDGTAENLIYTLDYERLPAGPGIYVFARGWGTKTFEVLYVGRTNNIRSRVRNQLNNHKLMRHLERAKTGTRVIALAKVRTKPGQRLNKVLALVERAIIRHFLLEGHDLVNKQGSRIRRHEITSHKRPKWFIPSSMYVEKVRRG
ncbi:MAG: hypothetical protein ACE5JC_03015 [Candidatus Zixiibacteriota bacterium]